LWGQAAWAHIRDKERFLRHWLHALKNDGRIAVEDAFLAREPTSQDSILSKLEYQWKAYLVTMAYWCELFLRQSCRLIVVEDLTIDLKHYYGRLLRNFRDQAPKEEVASWDHALHLARDGVLIYGRI